MEPGNDTSASLNGGGHEGSHVVKRHQLVKSSRPSSLLSDAYVSCDI